MANWFPSYNEEKDAYLCDYMPVSVYLAASEVSNGIRDIKLELIRDVLRGDTKGEWYVPFIKAAIEECNSDLLIDIDTCLYQIKMERSGISIGDLFEVYCETIYWTRCSPEIGDAGVTPA